MHQRGDFEISPRFEKLHKFLQASGHHVTSRLQCKTYKEIDEFCNTEKDPPVRDTIPLKEHYKKCGLAGLSSPIYMQNECAAQLVKDAWELPSRSEALQQLYKELAITTEGNTLTRFNEDILHKVSSHSMAACLFFICASILACLKTSIETMQTFILFKVAKEELYLGTQTGPADILIGSASSYSHPHVVSLKMYTTFAYSRTVV